MSDPNKFLQQRLRDFARERDWDQFHTPKNIAMALAGEVGELLAELQWSTDAEIRERLATDESFRSRVEEELADVHLYLLRLADLCGTDLNQVSNSKIDRNAQKYPIDKARGTAEKYTRLT